MRNRSQIHLLRVLAARFELDAPQAVTKAIRNYAEELEDRRLDGRDFNAAEKKRVEHQRTLFNFLPDSNATDRLREAMMQRAYDLIWDGDGMGCDALLEFLPSDSAEEILNAWENDLDEEAPKSRFH